jgi:hypothetical protein
MASYKSGMLGLGLCVAGMGWDRIGWVGLMMGEAQSAMMLTLLALARWA